MTRASRFIAALFVALSAPVHAGGELGTLFTTPAQRAALDRVRIHAGGEVAQEEKHEAADAPAPEAPARAAIKIDGVVRSSSGQTITWINGARPSKDSKYKAEHTRTGEINLIVGADGRRVALKPGQTYDPDTGAVRDNAKSTAPNNSAACRSEKSADGETRIVCEPSTAK
jgi:hypothetical protein